MKITANIQNATQATICPTSETLLRVKNDLSRKCQATAATRTATMAHMGIAMKMHDLAFSVAGDSVHVFSIAE